MDQLIKMFQTTLGGFPFHCFILKDMNESFGSQSALITTFNATTPPSTEVPKERMYQRKLADDDEGSFHRGSTRRTSRSVFYAL